MKKIIVSMLTLSMFAFSAISVSAEIVSMNTKTLKFHNSTCQYWNCKNCIKIDKQKALQRGAKPCKKCGG